MGQIPLNNNLHLRRRMVKVVQNTNKVGEKEDLSAGPCSSSPSSTAGGSFLRVSRTIFVFSEKKGKKKVNTGDL
jgi:hypothetical protein